MGTEIFTSAKSRSFHIHKSHLSEPKWLSQLLIVSALAYIWIVYLGVCALQEEWRKRLHRRKRCDLSLFRLVLRLLACALKDHISIPEGFLPPGNLPVPLTRHFRIWLSSSSFLSGSQG